MAIIKIEKLTNSKLKEMEFYENNLLEKHNSILLKRIELIVSIIDGIIQQMD